MVEYTAPVFWTFLFLVGIALLIFRWREPARAIPSRVPLYPVTPLLFCATSLYLLYSSYRRGCAHWCRDIPHRYSHILLCPAPH